MSIASDSPTRPSTSAVPFSHWLHAPNSPGLVSPPRDSDRTNTSDPMNLPNGFFPGNRYGTALPFRHQVRAASPPGFVSSPRNLDRTSLYDPRDFAAGSAFTDRITRPNASAVPFSHWLHAPNPPDPVSQPRRSGRRFNHAMNNAVTQLTDRRARERTHAENGRATASGLDNYQNPHTQTEAGLYAPASAPPNMKPETFLKSLPVLSLTDLPKDGQECPICLEMYQGPPHEDNPVRLPCSHVIGKDCLLGWLKTCNVNGKKNTCPICRAILFDHDTSSREAWQQRINDVLGQVPELSRPSVRNDVDGLDRVARRIPTTTREVNQTGGRYRDRANQFDDRMIEIWERAGNTERAEEARERRARRLRGFGDVGQGVGTEDS